MLVTRKDMDRIMERIEALNTLVEATTRSVAAIGNHLAKEHELAVAGFDLLHAEMAEMKERIAESQETPYEGKDGLLSYKNYDMRNKKKKETSPTVQKGEY